MEKKSENGSLSNLDPLNVEIDLDHHLDTKNPDFLTYYYVP